MSFLMNDDKKIFNDQGFLTKEGAAFVNDGFNKELAKVINTATSPNDVIIISALLKNLVDNACSQVNHDMIKSQKQDVIAHKLTLIQGGKT